MYTLGINAALAEPCACLVKDGAVVAAAEEERFTGYRTARKVVPFSPCELPFHAINSCLARENVVLSDIDHIAYSFNPFIPPGRKAQSAWDPLFLSAVAGVQRQLCSEIPGQLASVWHFVDHHLAHAAGAFLASPFLSAAVITLDNGGETAATTYSLGKSNRLTSLGEVGVQHSLSRLYRQVAEYLGFHGFREELRVAELSALGEPLYSEELRGLILLKGNGQYAVEQDVRLSELFGAPRAKNEPVGKKHLDIAASLQLVIQETVLSLLHWLKDETGENNLCLSGDLALNIALNSCIRQNAPFSRIWVPPSAGDAGTALGAALWIDGLERVNLDGPRRYVMDRADLGPEYPSSEIEAFLAASGTDYRRLADIPGETAGLLSAGKTVAWFQGKMELGANSLGCRSILGSPLHDGARRKMESFKNGEEFRQIALAVPEEKAGDWFLEQGDSPFALFYCGFRPQKSAAFTGIQSECPAALLTVGNSGNALFHSLLDSFGEKTGVPILLHTALNPAGKPVACSPRDAAACFWTMPLDALVLGDFLIEKK